MKSSNTPNRRYDLSRRRFIGSAVGAAAVAAGTGITPAVGAAQDEALTAEITYWHHFTSESEMAALEEAQAAFAEQYPNVTVTAENIPNADYMTQFTTAAVGGALPDTAMATVDRIPDMLALGGLTDLTDRFSSWEGSGNIPDSLMIGATVDEQIFGVPMFLFVDWLYYRQDWFDEAGLTPPTTWEEFQDVAIALTDPDQGRYGFGLRGGDGGQDHVLNIMRSFGGLSIDEEGVPVIERDAAIEAIGFWAGLYTNYEVAPPSAPNDSYSQIMQAFRTGQTGMLLHHTGSLAEILGDLTTDQVSTTLPPAGPVEHVVRVAPQYNSILTTDNEDAAWAWLTHWQDPDVSIQFLETTGYFPASTEAASDPRITDNPIYDAAREAIEVGTLPLQFVGAPGWSRTSVLPAFQQVLTDQATPQEAVDQMIADLEAEIG